jgi:hypothetical protein
MRYSLPTGVLPDGRVALVDSTTYEVKLIEVERGVVQRLRRPIAPRSVTRRDQEDERARQLEEVAQRAASGGGATIYSTGGEGGGSRRISSSAITTLLEDRIQSMEFGEEIPVVSGLAADWAGRIWLERAGARVGEEGPIDVLSGEGAYLGSLAPGQFRIPSAFGPGDLAAWVEKDEMDVPRVVVKRLTVG